MRRLNWKTVSTLIAMIAVAGCQENIASPAISPSGPAALSRAPQSRPNFSLSYDASAQNATADFTVGVSGGLFAVGNHAVYFPANVICDPATSSYGVGSWDDSCTVLKGSISIHAESRMVNGKPWIDFTPALRFAPSANPARWVWLYMSMPGVSSSNLSQFNILYAPTIGGPAYDEALTDPTLRTYIGHDMGLRRIKHFSGYTWTGNSCEPGTDCGAGDNSGVTP